MLGGESGDYAWVEGPERDACSWLKISLKSRDWNSRYAFGVRW